MKAFLIFFSTILISQAIISSPSNSLQLGQNCDFLFPTITSVNLTSNPWPPTAGVTLKILLTGVLTKDEAIGDVIVTHSSGTSSSKTNVTVNAFYASKSTFVFNYNLQAPVQPGNYNEKFQATQNVTQSQLMCWQISYVI